MPTPDRILTRHPAGKHGVNIEREKYETVKAFLLETVREHGEIAYQDLSDLAEARLGGSFSGSVAWYVVTVKLDLEARGVLRRVPKSSPHRLVLADH